MSADLRSPLRRALFPAVLSLAGVVACRSMPEERAWLDPRHPASPEAPVGRTMARSGVLDPTRDVPGDAVEPEGGGPDPGGHAGHAAIDADPMETQAGEPARFACPMHPEVVSDAPGACPECGMALRAVAEERAQEGGAGAHDH